ncbi:reverse transcriptase domain-containing protein [Tanacetum coccineum]
MPSNVKTYDGSEDPEDHLKIFQAAAKVKRIPRNFLQQKKCIKDPVEIHHIKQREWESTEDFVQRFKTESKHVKGAPECMRISGFMHGITNPELIKRLYDKIPKSVDEMMRITTTFLRGKVAASNQTNQRINQGWKAVARNQGTKIRQRKGSAESNKEGRSFREGQSYGDPNGPTMAKVARQRVAQSFSPYPEISFLPLGDEDGTEGPMVIEAEIGGHFIHHLYVDRGSASEIPYEHCFNRLRPKVKNQMVPATVPLIGFSGEVIWPMGQISLPVKIGDTEHSTSAWMNFVVVRSPFPYNGIIGRPESNTIIPLECTMVSGPEAQPSASTRVAEEKIKVAIHSEYPEQTIAIGSTLTEERRRELCDLLRRNLYIFAWKLADMTGFRDAYKGYHQIKMAKDDEEKMAFITSQGISEECWSNLSTFDRQSILETNRQELGVEQPEDDPLAAPIEVEEELSDPWTLFTDGSSYIDGSGAGLILTDPKGTEFTYALRFRFDATNNEAEYEALIAGLRIAEQMGVENLQTHMDSCLVANQINGSYIAKEPAEVLTIVEEEGNTWMTPIYEYLTEETHPAESKKAKAVRLKSRRYAVIDGVLSKKYFLEPWLWCVKPLQENYVIREIHEGSYNMHVGPRSVVAKVIRIGYYWPTMHKEARKVIRELSSLPFRAKEPATEGPGKVKFLIVAMDYFTKWIEAKPVATITGNQIKYALPPSSIRKLTAWWKEQTEVWDKGNGDAPFLLTYGTKAIIQAEIGMPTLRTTEIDMVQNDEALELNLEQTTIREARSKAKMKKIL